jgi:soluble lytic murein transglycosylase-like protein
MAGLAAIEAMTARVTGAVRSAAARTGTDFSYLMAQARIESGLNPVAKARTSTASGLFQFTASTWLDTVRKHGAEHGLAWAADAIASGAARSGTAARATILSLRDDAQAAALMAGEFAADNGAVLAGKLDRAVGATDLYMAHFLGAGGATTFLKALQNSPGAAAASLFPAAAAANHSVFFGRDGAARSLSDVYARFSAKLGTATDRPVRLASSGSALPATGNSLPVSADRARLAYLLLAELGA